MSLIKFDTAWRYGRVWEEEEIKGSWIKFKYPNKYSHVLLKDFISTLNKRKMYNDSSIVTVSYSVYFSRLKAQKKEM